MFDVFNAYATDEKKELEGVDIPLGKDAGFRVARAGNAKYARRINEEYEKHRDLLDRGGKEAEDLDTQILIDVMAETILLNFWGMTYKGEVKEYSLENAKLFLGIKDFRLRVHKEASKFDNFRAVHEKADLGNS